MSRPLPIELRPVAGYPVVDVVPAGATTAQAPYTARRTVLTVQLAWWQHRMGVEGPFYLYERPDPDASVGDRFGLGACFGRLAQPVEEVRLFGSDGERVARVVNHVWMLEER